ncbi:hypothetical protein [Streptomyces sp. NBC_00826]|uniref:hypothetical protein n=1 Tax=Streptomyces sp. NBC_00826 TaxID=2975845 RepID=UPI002F90A2F2|nr:hypothetical protein OG832_44800 [Streptomyces sp. NBC_00826]WTB60587.1 hypothetical protein OG832_47100 [Streptomyces sp. NBC_00826]
MGSHDSPSSPGLPGFDYIDLPYPVAGVAARFPVTTGSYPPRHALSPAEQAMMSAVAADMWRRTFRFSTPEISALEGQHAAVHGHQDVVDHVGRTTLGLRNAGTSYWREAVSTALLSDWAPLLGENNSRLLVPQRLKKEAEQAHRDTQPLWERKVNGHRVTMLDTPTAGGLTRADLAADTAEPDDGLLRDTINEPRVREILAELDPDERDVALAYARNPSIRSWTEAARSTGAKDPERFGERVRRRLKRLGDRHDQHTSARGAKNGAEK